MSQNNKYTLEQNIERIADALTVLAEKVANPMVNVPTAAQPTVSDVPKPNIPEAPNTIATPNASTVVPQQTVAAATVTPEPPVPQTPTAAPAPMSADDLNTLLMQEVERLGGEQVGAPKIFAVLNGAPFNVANVSALDPSRYPEVVAAVKALV